MTSRSFDILFGISSDPVLAGASAEERLRYAKTLAEDEQRHTTLALDVRDFMRACGQAVSTKPVLHPNLKVRLGWIREEVAELEQAIQDDDLAGVADGLIDIVYITLGGAVECGLDFGHLWAEVHRANMRKVPFDPTTGKHRVLRAPDGKVQKPPGWTPPKLLPLLVSMGLKVKGEQ